VTKNESRGILEEKGFLKIKEARVGVKIDDGNLD